MSVAVQCCCGFVGNWDTIIAPSIGLCRLDSGYGDVGWFRMVDLSYVSLVPLATSRIWTNEITPFFRAYQSHRRERTDR